MAADLWPAWTALLDLHDGSESDLLEAHGIAPCLFHCAEDRSNLQAIQKQAHTTRALCMAQSRAMQLCRDALSDLPYLLLKGAALGAYAYPEPWLRTGGDVDLLVDPENADEAISRLVAAEFQRSLSAGGSLVFRAREMQVRRQGFRVAVDVHWALVSRPALARRFDFAELLDAAIEAEHDRVLHPVHALLHACMHRYGHHPDDPDRLIWLMDTHLLWSGFDKPGQERVIELAIERGLACLLLASLKRAVDLLGTKLSPAHEQTLKAAANGESCRRLLQTPAPGFWFDFGHLGTVDRFKYLGQILFPSRDYMHRRYPGSKWPLPLLYLRRAVRGAIKGRQ